MLLKFGLDTTSFTHDAGTSDTVLYTVRGVGGLGIRMLTLDTKTFLYVTGSGDPSTDHSLSSYQTEN